VKRRRGGGEGGFALIESIAVLALSALVLVTLLLAGQIVIHNSGAAVRRAHEIEALATGFAALRRDLSGAFPARAAGGAEAGILFEGGPSALSVAVAGAGVDSHQNSLVRIEASEEDGRGRLVRSSARLLPQVASLDSVAFGNAAIAIAGPWSFRFGYAAMSPEGLQWNENWTNPRALPAAIRLEVLAGKGDDVVLPPLIVKLHIDAEVECDESVNEACADEKPEGEEPVDEPLEEQ
jgi:general secretion pathway protein J